MPLPDMTSIAKATVYEDSDVTFLARLMVDSNNTLAAAVQSDFSAITYKVYDGLTSVATGTLDAATVIYNALQTGTIWGVDQTGFNFKAVLPASAFPEGSKNYVVEIKFVLATNVVFFVLFQVNTVGVQTS